MKHRPLELSDAAEDDIFEAWLLVYEHDGEERADALKSRIMAFIFGLEDFAEIGSRHEDLRPGFRSSGVPGLKTATVYFVVSDDQVTVVGVSYLGRNVWGRFREAR